MANWYIAADKGMKDDPSQIYIGTSTQSKDFELNVLTTNTPKKKDVILFLEKVIAYYECNGRCGNQSGVAAGTDMPVL